ncbi:hypothetical protein AGOR_G00243300 [Albula goreensis]|uniref:WW domain-containing protein n=1 Tax=Albula goreensis TaxID=1534307 RepID=A0A8T3CIL5_9TELE|nr:hypothetical protein AGOR_G00243300 [Albula goreensis]
MSNQLQPYPGQQVVHVARDLDTDLEALFNSVMNPKPSSWRKKMLPESFFKEPDLGTHSRQSSSDSGSHTPRLIVRHARSHSSPASLQLGAGARATPSPAHHAHLRQQSFDVADELPLPPGWEMAFTATGQRYFLNHVEKITTWQDPRKTMTTGMNQMSLQGGHGARTPAQASSAAALCPSPPWPALALALALALASPSPSLIPCVVPEQRAGSVLFCEHVYFITDPPCEPPLLATEGRFDYLGRPHLHGPMEGWSRVCLCLTEQDAISPPLSLVMPHHHQHQQAQAQPMGSSPPLSQQGLQQQGTQAGLMGLPNPLTTQQQHQQKMRLQRIQLERERIRMRQEELMRQEVALCRQMPLDSNSMAVAPAPISAAPLSQGNMPNPSTDPFLNSGPYHSREQSTDSGLGLGCYSVPTTPEDFLSSMEEMDTGDSMAQSSLGPPQQSRFPDFLDSLPGTNVDLGTLEGADLIPILNDVESVLGKAEPYLTWL